MESFLILSKLFLFPQTYKRGCSEIKSLQPRFRALFAFSRSVFPAGDLLILRFGDNALADRHLHHGGGPQAALEIALDHFKIHALASLHALVRQGSHHLILQRGGDALDHVRRGLLRVPRVLKGLDGLELLLRRGAAGEVAALRGIQLLHLPERAEKAAVDAGRCRRS